MKMRKQRFMGLIMLALSAAIIAIAFTGTTPEDTDITAVLITLPLGVYMLFTKKYILSLGEEETTTKAHDTWKMKGVTIWQENELPKPRQLSHGKKSIQLSGRSLRQSSHWVTSRQR